MATVYLARLSGVGGFQRFVAIKRLHPHLAREPEFIEMFLEEARLAARIHHPNVVPILEIGQSERGYYIVMEYVEGDTLGRMLARSAQTGQRLPTKVGLRVVIDMLAGLDAAHELKDDDGKALGIVHRDISPQNVLVGVDGSARLSDFGVARATSKLSTTRTGQLKGKLAYMAPEQAKGSREIDRRADVFAAGIVLWEVLACRRLFKGDGEADTLNRVLNDPIPPVRSAAATVPAALEAVVARALERDRAKRYATAAEFADALERASRVVGALGTHKEVAAYLDSVLGTEISAQREVVRAWLARSEPSRHGVDTLQRPDSTSVTRVEGSGSGSISGPPSGSSRVSPVSAVSSVSSVTSAVAQPSGGESATSQPSPMPVVVASPLQRRGRVWPWVGLVAAMLAGGVILVASSRGGAGGPSASPAVVVGTARGPAAAAPPSPPAGTAAAMGNGTAANAADPPAATSPSPSATAGSGSPAATPPYAAVNGAKASATGVGPGSHAPRPGAARPVSRAVSHPTETPAAQPPPAATPAPATAAPQPAATVPDDISRNPYR